MSLYPVLCYDYETCNDYSFQELNSRVRTQVLSKRDKNLIIAKKSFPMELSCLFVRDEFSKPVFMKTKIKFPKRYENCSDYEKDGLKFYFDHQKGYDNCESFNEMIKIHNSEAYQIDAGLLRFVRFIRKYVGIDDNEDIKRFLLVGKNNLQFDDLILREKLSVWSPQNVDNIFSNVFDVQKFIFDNRYNKTLSNENKSKYFRFIKNQLTGTTYDLSNIYYHLFDKKLDNAHDSKSDVLATYKIFKLYYDKFPITVKESCCVSYVDLGDQFTNFKSELN